jgi:hypothetical protein
MMHEFKLLFSQLHVGVTIRRYLPNAEKNGMTTTDNTRAVDHERDGQLSADSSIDIHKLHVRIAKNNVEIAGGENGERKLTKALGMPNPQSMRALVIQLAKVTMRDGKADEGELNLMISFICDGKPRDQVEAFLLAQMAISHVMGMRYANYVVNSDFIDQQDSGERIFSKSIRTYAMQMEALKRYRTLELQAAGARREQTPEKKEKWLPAREATVVPTEASRALEAELAPN